MVYYIEEGWGVDFSFVIAIFWRVKVNFVL